MVVGWTEGKQAGKFGGAEVQTAYDAVSGLRALLERYIRHVVQAEGTDFLSDIEAGMSDVKFTPEELVLLRKLSGWGSEAERK
jgi:hypothetical protein